MGTLVNRYHKGMVKDAFEFFQPEGTYTSALNAVPQSRTHVGFGLVNEYWNSLAHKFNGVIKGHSLIEERNQVLYFIRNGNRSEIWILDIYTDEATFVCADKEFGDCDWGFDACEFLYGEFKQFNECNELHVYWSSKCIYHVINIDEMLNDKRKQAVIEGEDCSYFDVFQVTCGPHISAIGSKNGGSKLEGGVIRFAIQLETNDGGVSNVFDVSQPVYLETEDNVSGQISTMSAKLRIGNLDKRWNNVIIYVIHTVGQITTIKRMPSASYGEDGFTFEYYGQEGEIVDISTVIHKSKAWLRGQDLIQKDGRMIYYGIKNEKNLNYQKYANNIELEWVEYEVTIEQQLKYHFPSLLRGEIYAFAIVFKYADGTYSPAFHIPGIPGLGEEALENNSIQAARASTSYSRYCLDGSGNCVACSYCEECSTCEPTGEGTTGNTATGGDTTIEAGAEDYYNPMQISDLDTAQQFERKRNPSEPKDRKHESDKLEDAVQSHTDNIDTGSQDIIDAAECQDSLYGCDELKDATTKDLDDLFNAEKNNVEILAGMGKNDPDPDLNTTTTLKDAASKLIEDAVTNREYVTRKRPTLNYTQSSVPNDGETPGDPEANLDTEMVDFKQKGVGKVSIKTPVGSRGTIRGDNWVDRLGLPITEQKQKVVGRGKFEPYESVVQYPDNKDCDGKYFYPQTNQYFHQVPWTSERPHYKSYQNGVVNKYQPDNYEYSKTFIRLMGLKVTNIKFPDQDELPKPLCPNSPFKIVYVKRTDNNKTIFAKGWLSGMFTGSVYGDTQVFPRHGVNSFERVDRFIAAGDSGTSRLGEHSDEPIYTFHSPDTDSDNSFLPITRVKPELGLRGSGWKHGDYAEGERPTNPWTGKKRDQAGTRVSNNLNHYTLGSDDFVDIVGFSYAPSDSVLTKPPGMSYTLNNRYRESSVYLELSGRVIGDSRDNSFIGATLEHFFPLQCNAPYVALCREVPDLYGSVDGLKYIDLGLNATQVHAQGTNAIEGICGDTWIGPYSKRRTSYVSNKQGNFFNPPQKDGSPCRPVSWCESPEDILFEYTGIDFYPTKLPKSGDIHDPKNYAGLHTVTGPCGEFGLSRTAAASAAIGDSESDFYYPRTLKSLVHTIVESHVNPALLQTGEGSQLEEGKVYYPKLKDLHLDSEAPNKNPWEKSFLNRFYRLIEQPSRQQLWKKAAIRSFLNVFAPVVALFNFKDIEAIMDGVMTFGILPLVFAFWIMAVNTLFTDQRLNQMLGIGECLRDEEGGDLDENIDNFEDAYCRYNLDYSTVNDIQYYHAFTLPYNTCDCDACDKSQTNNEIYYSDKQNLDSEIDAYRMVRMNNYTELPAHHGKLGRLFSLNNNLYAHTNIGFSLLKVSQDLFNEQIAYQQAGSGLWLAEPQLLFEGVEGGFSGTQHPNAGIVTPYGYIFVDDNANKIYRFTGSVPQEISAFGMESFFRENLGFCEPKACYDEKSSTGIGYALGWDPRYNRLLVTKQDGNDCSSFTASFVPGGEGGRWISFHSYKPQAYLWDRSQFFSLKYNEGEVWRHNVPGGYNTFYGQIEPFMVEFMASHPSLITSTTPISLNLLTKAEKNGLKDLDETFTRMAMWNSTQGTGWLNINEQSDNFAADQSQQYKQNYGKIKYTKTNRIWSANGFKDLIKNDCIHLPLLTQECECQAIPDINQDIFDCTAMNKQGISNKLFADNFLMYRYELLGRNDLQLHLIEHRTTDNIE